MTQTEVESMVIRLVGDGSSYSAMLKQAVEETHIATRQIQSVSTTITGYGYSLKSYATVAVATMTGLVGVTAGLATAFNAVKLSAAQEDMQVEFGTLLQDVEKGKGLVKEIQQFAAATPLNQADIQQAAKTLLQFNATGGDVIDTIRQIGDVAGGDANKLQRLTLAFAQAASKGRLMGEERLQLTEAGFNPLQEIARTSGKSVNELEKMMEKGQISIDMLRAAFKSATSQGGMFFNGMENRSKTLTGLFSTLQDDVDSALRKIGDVITEQFDLKWVVQQASLAAKAVEAWVDSPVVKSGIKGTADLLKWLKNTIIDTFTAGGEAVYEFIRANSALLLQVAAGVAVYKSVQLAVTGFYKALALVQTVMAILKVQQIAAIALWAAWAAVTVVTKGAMLLFSATMWVLNTAVAAATAAWGIYTTATVAAGVATTVLEGIIAVLEAETIIPIIAAIATLSVVMVALGGIFTIVGAAFYGVYKAAIQVYDVLSLIPTTSGPLEEIGRIIGEWGVMLREVAKVAETDLPMAFMLLKQAGAVAVSQLQDLWPPLWEFIKAGFGAVGTAASGAFSAGFKLAIAEVSLAVADLMKTISTGIPASLAAINPVLGALKVGLSQASAAVKGTAEEVKRGAEIDAQLTAKNAKQQMEAAISGFSLKESDQTKAAKEEFDKLRAGIAEDLATPDETKAEQGKQKYGDIGTKLGQSFAEKASHGIHKFDAALVGSAEAFTRIAEYQAGIDRVGKVMSTSATTADRGGYSNAEPRSPVEGKGGVLKENNSVIVDLLKSIDTSTKETAKKKPVVLTVGDG